MEKISHKLFQVDAFASKPFEGNPAAVMVLDNFFPDDLMQKIAMENNLSETAFIVPKNTLGQYDLRWFTPTLEIDFCGHATIASAHILATEYGLKPPFKFHTQIGELIVSVSNNKYTMEAPRSGSTSVELSPEIETTFPFKLETAFEVDGVLFVLFETAEDIFIAEPNMSKIRQLSDHGVVITATNYESYDFISRYFVPEMGVDEDPVTGSAHARMGPYWAKRLGKTSMKARQVSKRGGDVWVDVHDNRVCVSGYAVTYMKGHIDIVSISD